MIGLDIGAGMTKGVLIKDSSIIRSFSALTDDAVVSASNILKDLLRSVRDEGSIDVIAVSGGGSRKIKERLCDLPIMKVDEIQAIGVGGLTLAGKLEGLIINAGTGTPIVAAYNEGRKVIHVGGTGVGGGTLLGLSTRILGTRSFDELEMMARKGDATKVDLTVLDIVGGPIGIVPAEATASNFGKIRSDASKEDIAAGLFNMVCQVIGVVGAMAAKAYSFENDVIVVGGLVRSSLASSIIRDTMSLFGVAPCIPENCEYCTAVGAARSVLIGKA